MNKHIGQKFNKLTQKEFVDRAKKIWEDRYDYSQVKYTNNYTKVKITCNKCNHDLLIRPHDHITHKTGCPYCAGNIKKTTKQFIKEAQKIHGDNYDYSKSIYKNAGTAIEVICNKCRYHFFRIPYLHLKQERGCKKCNQRAKNQLFKDGEPERKKQRLVIKHNKLLERQMVKNETFIQKAKQRHGNKYNYVLTEYKSASSKVDIICNKCQTIFKQTICKHLHGSNCCPTCNAVCPNVKTTEQFISESKLVYGNKYNYSMTNYHNRETKVKIACNQCNDVFLQKPYNHLQGLIGCKCSGRQRIFLKDGTICDSMVEAYHYLLLKEQNIEIKHHGLYGGELGQRLYDFYIPKDNIYIEVTGYNKQNRKKWFGYLRNIVKKKHYVVKMGAKFQFIQYKKLTSAQRRIVRQQRLSI